MSCIKVYVSDTEAVEACIRFIDDDDDMGHYKQPINLHIGYTDEYIICLKIHICRKNASKFYTS